MNEQTIRWKGFDPRKYNEAGYLLGDFFEGLEQYTESSSSENIINNIDFSGIVFREEQANYAYEIMEAIKRQQILIVEAGVGIGKSFGYLLPIFYTIDNVEYFNKVIISTSSIALQVQLLADISKLSKMLGIKVKAEIVKGINNYACLNRIYYQLDNHLVDRNVESILRSIVNEIRRIKSADKVDLQQVSKEVWEQVRLKNRGYCSKCDYSRSCPFYKKQESISASNIIITNHANMARNVLDKSELVADANMIVFDEAHKLMENIQGIRTEEFDLETIKKLIANISSLLSFNFTSDRGISFRSSSSHLGRDNTKLFEALNKLFSRIMASASKNFFETNKKNGNEKDYAVTDSNRLGFRNTETVKEWLNIVLIELDKLLEEIKLYERRHQTKIDTKVIEYLYHIKETFEDMKKGENSEFVYWADFYKKNKIKILRVPKSSLDVTKDIFNQQIPIILTFGTITENGIVSQNESDYSRFLGSLGLDKIVGREIKTEDSHPSPYDYDTNSLFYYNTDIANPNDGKNYIRDLAIEIAELIRITNGKALILFTSKKTMNAVYDLLKDEEFPFELLLQTDNNTALVKEYFTRDTNSCLFATGAFWEGIDVKGKSLSNLIITRLPFDQVDAVTQYEASKYAEKEQFRQVYFPKMLTKFEQAVGRLIRSDTDTGIVCCLDSRIGNYINLIAPNIPINKFVTDKSELYKFADDKILSESEIQTRNQQL